MSDWRLDGQEEYLSKKKLVKIHFRAYEDYDHDHCAFCWDKFSELDEDLHIGYSTLDGKYIICETCYNDFKDLFEWTIEWRLTDQGNYLYQKTLKKCDVVKDPLMNSACCSFCKNKFGEFAGMLKEGYRTQNNSHCVCEKCYQDFKEMFEWKVE